MRDAFRACRRTLRWNSPPASYDVILLKILWSVWTYSSEAAPRPRAIAKEMMRQKAAEPHPPSQLDKISGWEISLKKLLRQALMSHQRRWQSGSNVMQKKPTPPWNVHHARVCVALSVKCLCVRMRCPVSHQATSAQSDYTSTPNVQQPSFTCIHYCRCNEADFSLPCSAVLWKRNCT